MNGRIKMSEKLENLDGYETLAAAIVLCAAQDYREAYGNIYFYNDCKDFEKGKQAILDKIKTIREKEKELLDEKEKAEKEKWSRYYYGKKISKKLKEKPTKLYLLLKSVYKEDRKYSSYLSEIDSFNEFIHSDWYDIITTINGDFLKRSMEREARNGNIKGFKGI